MTVTDLERRLSRRTGRRIRIVLTNNRHHVLTYRRHRNVPDELRLSRFFLRADDEILRALAAFLLGSRAAHLILQRYVDRENERVLRRRAARGLAVQTQGETHDLERIFKDLNRRYFGRAVRAHISWGPRRSTRGRKSIQLGVYDRAQRLIRIHPVLDQPHVPRHVVEKVVFHEMLHHVLDRRTATGERRCLHGPEFLELERTYEHFTLAERWLTRNLARMVA